MEEEGRVSTPQRKAASKAQEIIHQMSPQGKAAAAAASKSNRPITKNNKASKRPPPHPNSKKQGGGGKKSKTKAPGVKQEKFPTDPPRQFTKEEDGFLARAFVSMTVDPIHGTDQQGKVFWRNVKKRFYAIYDKEAEVQVLGRRDDVSFRNRWQRNIHKDVQVWNVHYRKAKTPLKSGWKEEDYLNEACEQYRLDPEKKGPKVFKYLEIVHILHKVVKFNPMNKDYNKDEKTLAAEAAAEAQDGESTTAQSYNKLGSVTGDNLERPLIFYQWQSSIVRWVIWTKLVRACTTKIIVWRCCPYKC